MLPLAQEMQQILLRKTLEVSQDALTCVYPRYRYHPWTVQQRPVAAVVVLDESLLRRSGEVRSRSSQASELEMVETEVEMSLSQATEEPTAKQAFQEGIPQIPSENLVIVEARLHYPQRQD